MFDTSPLEAALTKANWTRLLADYVPVNDDGYPEGWRIHDLPQNSGVAYFICGEMGEHDAAAIVAAVNAAPGLIADNRRLAERVARLEEALRGIALARANDAENLTLCADEAISEIVAAGKLADQAAEDLAEKAMLAGIAEGARQERAAIVAWLRGETPTYYTDPQYDIGANLADAIERGDHLKETGQ
jgi:hypothetical protein